MGRFPDEHLQALEQKRAKVARQRHVWIAHRQPFMAHMIERIGFLDETWLKTNMAKRTGWAPRGQRLVDHAPFGHWRTQTFVAALRHDRLDAPWVIDGTMNRATFDTYVETQLVQTLSKGDVIILDNLSSHKSARAAEMLNDLDAWFVSRGKPSTGRSSHPSNSCRHTHQIWSGAPPVQG